ncbi:methenyltetrahydromethanopterin cyclohydrolase [Halocatena halophila]|uniref:methenyltetrahydromethanopterin cyclohydrolase n=1 Tax=Halocatena halophila TaxID=2814576 RepID=UPI002ED494DE
MESLNRMATELVDEALEFTDELAIDAYELETGTTVLDFGVEAIGGIEAGLLLTEIQTAGLATVSTTMGTVDDTPRPMVELTTDHPAFALLCSQKAGWELTVAEDDWRFDALGSGPARALVATEEEFRKLGYADAFEFAVLALEAEQLPTEAVAEQVAQRCDVDTGQLFLPTVSMASMAGSTTMAARAAELTTFRAFERGYDPLDVLSISAKAPLAPVAASEPAAIARTNDALAYGGTVHLTVEQDAGAELFGELISSAPSEYGDPFEVLFEAEDWQLEALDPDVYGPAQVTVDVVGGPTYSFGERDDAVLAESFGL